VQECVFFTVRTCVLSKCGCCSWYWKGSRRSWLSDNEAAIQMVGQPNYSRVKRFGQIQMTAVMSTRKAHHGIERQM
jgi:hypothetical protein